MAVGSKCKYLLYIASAAADWCTCWLPETCSKFSTCLCLIEEGDHCRCGSPLIKPTNSTVYREHSSSL